MHFNKYYKKAFADPILAKYGEVSFKTFVQHILNNKGCRMRIKCSLDTHWLPFYINCGYCSLRYKYFVRAEHFDTDTKYIGLLTNINFEEIGELVKGNILAASSNNSLFANDKLISNCRGACRDGKENSEFNAKIFLAT